MYHQAPAPVRRMGLMSTNIPVNGGYGATAHGTADYGRILGIGWPVWLWKKSKYQECAGYRKAVDSWVKVKKNGINKYGKVPGWFRGEGAVSSKMKSLEAQGKAAWKVCKSAEKGAKKGWTDIDVGGGNLEVGAMGVDPLTGLPVDPLTGLPMDDYASMDTGSETPWGLLAGVGVLAAVVGGVIIMRRRKARG
jgi:LPXTG-motif cell wall-anchored protein